MMSGVITLRNMLSRKSSQPSAPSASRMASSGGAAAMIMKETRRKNRMAMRQPREKAERVVDDAVALDRVADLELHDRHAGELGRQVRSRRDPRPSSCGFRRRRRRSLLLVDDFGIERQHDQRQLAVVRRAACRG